MSFNNEYQYTLQKIEEGLLKIFEKYSSCPGKLIESMKYSVFAGGKRLRPVMLIQANKMVGGCMKESLPIACGLEMIHTYSLIHDDLPAMDNDDYRRGKPTNHRVFGEGMAILAGDGLLNMAYETIIDNALQFPQKIKNHLNALRIIASAAGVSGMIGGQAADLEWEGKTLDHSTLKYIHEHKTAALFTASLEAGIILETANEELITSVRNYGNCLGLAFQIIDDILDVTGESEKMGKSTGSDIRNEKATYIRSFGLEKSQKMARELIESSVEALAPFGTQGSFLRELSYYILNRRN